MLRWLVPVLALAFAATLGPVPHATADPTTIVATVTRVVDGDTVKATTANGTRITVRVLGIDTPETRDPRKPVQCWGPEASRWAHQRLDGVTVTLVPDPSQAVRDRYGRMLAYIRADGRDYSVDAARAGMARSYVYARHPVSEHQAIADAVQEAQQAHRGLWGSPCNGQT